MGADCQEFFNGIIYLLALPKPTGVISHPPPRRRTSPAGSAMKLLKPKTCPPSGGGGLFLQI